MTDEELRARLTRIDTLRSRLGLGAVLCALSAVGFTALGLAAVKPGRFIAFGLLAIGATLVAARLRLAWTRVSLARAAAARAATPPSSPSN